MPFYDQYGNELIATPAVPAAARLAVGVEPLTGPDRMLGRVFRQRRIVEENLAQTGVTGAANTWVFGAPLYVDWAEELDLIVSLQAAATGTPANFQLALLISDEYTTLANSWICHNSPIIGATAPSGVSIVTAPIAGLGAAGNVVQVASPPNTVGPFLIVSYANIAALVRVGVAWGTAWATGGNVAVYAKVKG